MFTFNTKKTRSRSAVPGEVSFARQIFKGLWKVALVALLLYATYYLTRLPAVTIKTEIVEGGETISHDDVRARVEEELIGNYFALVPKRFTYLYPHDRIVSVLENIPKIYDVQLSLVKRTTLSVSFNEYIPHALWCAYEREDVPCYFIDEDGYAFAEAPQLQGGALVRHSVEGIEDIVQGQAIESAQLKEIDLFIDEVEQELGLRITALVHRKDQDLEFFVNGGGIILVASGNDFHTTFENLKSVLTSKEFQHLEPGNFQYIDVRFTNKVFVNEERVTEEMVSTSTDSILSE